MAQAPEGGISSAAAPRQNKTVKQFNGMNTQNRRNAIPEGSFGWLENIQPIGPGHLHSIPGRSSQVTLIPPFIPPPGTCVPIAPDGMSQVDTLFAAGIGPGQRWSWSFIADNPGGEIVYEAATNLPFPSLFQMYKSTNGTTTTDTYPAGVNGGANNSPGISDRVMFALASGGTFYLFTLEDNSQLEFNLGGHGFSGSNVTNWSVNGNTLFVGGNDLTDGLGHPIIAKYVVDTQVFVSFTVLFDINSIQSFHYNGEFLYVLVQDTPDTNAFRVLKYDTDFTLIDSFQLTPVSDPSNNAYIGIFAESDAIVYVLRRSITGPGIVNISYVHDFAEQVVLDSEVPGDFFALAAGKWTMIVHTDETTGEKYFYLGQQQQPQIFKYGFAICAS